MKDIELAELRGKLKGEAYMESQIEIYQVSDGQTQIEVKFEEDTV